MSAQLTLTQPYSSSEVKSTQEDELTFTPEDPEQESRYFKLRDFLQANDWRQADDETYRLMLQSVHKYKGDWIRNTEMRNFPCADLHTINKLWVDYSNGKFGFSAQKTIYYEIQYQYSVFKKPFSITGDEFTRCVGWLDKQGLYKERDNLTFSLDAPQGHLPYTLRISGRLRQSASYWHWLFEPLALRLIDCSI
jgi:GUN4-like